MAAYSGGVVLFDWYLATRFTRGHRRRMAHIMTMLDIGQVAPYAVNNLHIAHERVR